MIFLLEDPKNFDISIAGGKAKNLCKLISDGFPVPKGFLISAKACKHFLNHIDLSNNIKELNYTGNDYV